ncbi:MAG: transporter substrate-binding domain-containing protein, partial [Anaerolineae bacterium]|nr:transporter substrate-binding domain-containing protein [Anaerolineae bacterium]
MPRVLWLCAVLLSLLLQPASAQNAAPTLVPPTPVPYDTSAQTEAALSQSGLARILETGRVRIGVLYTEPAFGQFTERGEVRGYDADLARAMAEVWGVELRLRQVTRQTALEMLNNSEVDLLLAAMVHRRDLTDEVEFSQTYYQSAEAVMVRSDDPAQTLADLAGRRLGVVLGTPSEVALRDWAARTGFTGSIETFVTNDRMYGALGGGSVDGIVAPRHRLKQLAALEPEARR